MPPTAIIVLLAFAFAFIGFLVGCVYVDMRNEQEKDRETLFDGAEDFGTEKGRE